MSEIIKWLITADELLQGIHKNPQRSRLINQERFCFLQFSHGVNENSELGDSKELKQFPQKDLLPEEKIKEIW